MKRLGLSLMVALTLGLPGLIACEMDFIPWTPPEEFYEPYIPPEPEPDPTTTDPTTTDPTTTDPTTTDPTTTDPTTTDPTTTDPVVEDPPPPPPPQFVSAPQILFEMQSGREEPAPAASVVQWVEETLVLS